MENSRAPLG